MSKHHLRRARRLTLRALCGGAASVVSLAVLASGAQAATYQVTGTGGTLHVRTAPSLSAPAVAGLADGTRINIMCQTRGDLVVGSTMWDRINQPVSGYVADWYTTTPAVNAPSPGLPACSPKTPAPQPTPPPVITRCLATSTADDPGAFSEGLSGVFCYNGSHAWTEKYNATLTNNFPFVSTDIPGSGAFWSTGAYAGLGEPSAPAETVWSNEYVSVPGVPGLFNSALQEWRYLRITVSPTGVIHHCTWYTDEWAASPAPFTTSGTEGCD